MSFFIQTPAQSTFGETLGQALGTGLQQGMSERLNQMLEMKQQQAKTDQLMKALGLSQGAREAGPGAALESLRAEAPTAQAERPILKLTPERVLAASLMNPQIGSTLSKLYESQQSQEIQKKEEAESKNIAQNALNRASEILKKGNLGLFSPTLAKTFGGERAEDIGEFQSIMGALEAELVDRVSRGTLSDARFRYITETLLPKPRGS